MTQPFQTHRVLPIPKLLTVPLFVMPSYVAALMIYPSLLVSCVASKQISLMGGTSESGLVFQPN